MVDKCRKSSTMRLPRWTKAGRFVFPSLHLSQANMFVGKAPLSRADIRPAVHLGNGGNTRKGRFAMSGLDDTQRSTPVVSPVSTTRRFLLSRSLMAVAHRILDVAEHRQSVKLGSLGNRLSDLAIKVQCYGC